MSGADAAKISPQLAQFIQQVRGLAQRMSASTHPWRGVDADDADDDNDDAPKHTHNRRSKPRRRSSRPSPS